MKEGLPIEKPVSIISGTITDKDNYLNISIALSDNNKKMLFYSKKHTHFVYESTKVSGDRIVLELISVKIVSNVGSLTITDQQIKGGFWVLNGIVIASINDLIDYLAINTAM